MADRPNRPFIVNDTGISSTELVAMVVCVLWMFGLGAYFVMEPPAGPDGTVGSLQIVLVLMTIFLPVAVVWVAAVTARTSRVMREESFRLQAAIDGLRQSYMSERSQNGSGVPTVEKKLNEIAQTARKTETTLATFASKRDATSAQSAPMYKPRAEDQPTLALGTSAEDMSPPLTRAEFVRALNFPDNDQDLEGFGALRRALKDRTARQLVQASQDVLTLLSQDGIYMDDLRPDRARPEIWRRFAKGERGRTMAPLGGIRDRSSLALTAGRMREDTIFRDSAHHFLRLFDKMLLAFEPEASDEDLIALSETRTSRAFMLLGRVSGAFD